MSLSNQTFGFSLFIGSPILFPSIFPLPHHRAPEERAGGGVVGGRVYRVDGGDVEREDTGIFIRSRDIGDGRQVVELEEFSGKEHVGTE